MIQKRYHFLLLLACLVSLCKCTNFPDYPPGSPCTFTVMEPSNFDCFTKHAGNQKIKTFLNIVIKFYDPNNMKITDFDDQSTVIDPTINPYPIIITANVPNNGVYYEAHITISGEECSECANGSSDLNELPYGSCGTVPPNTTTIPWTSRAAKPRWSSVALYPNGYQATATISGNAISRILNIPNSCGCLVSW